MNPIFLLCVLIFVVLTLVLLDTDESVLIVGEVFKFWENGVTLSNVRTVKYNVDGPRKTRRNEQFTFFQSKSPIVYSKYIFRGVKELKQPLKRGCRIMLKASKGTVTHTFSNISFVRKVPTPQKKVNGGLYN